MNAGNVAAAALALVLAGGSVGASEQDLKNSVVKVFTVYNEYDYYRPWQMQGKQTKTGSGCIIDGQRVLTNAHVVADETFIQVKRAGKPEKYVASVEFVGHECDLALLRVGDDAFFEGTRPVRLGKLPHIRDKVAVYGFPTGGTKIAITEGVVSRVENLSYSHSDAYLLCCQVDAPINAGSSGGPVISGGKLVGVAFQSLAGNNIGYMVPAPVIEHFLVDIEDERYDGIPSLGIGYQKMENPDLRKRYLMREDQTGVLVNRAYPKSPCRGILDSGDVLMAVGDYPVANDATVEFRKGERTYFSYPAQCRQIGDSLSMLILRKGREKTVRVRLDIPSNGWQTVPREQYDTVPTYFVAGGFVFVPLTYGYLSAWGVQWRTKGPRRLVEHYFAEPHERKHEIVLIGQLLSDEVNMGYDDHLFTVVDSVNGREIREIVDLVAAFDNHEGEYHEVVDEDGYRVVLSAAKVRERKPAIAKRYKVPFDRSPNIKRPDGSR